MKDVVHKLLLDALGITNENCIHPNPSLEVFFSSLFFFHFSFSASSTSSSSPSLPLSFYPSLLFLSFNDNMQVIDPPVPVHDGSWNLERAKKTSGNFFYIFLLFFIMYLFIIIDYLLCVYDFYTLLFIIID